MRNTHQNKDEETSLPPMEIKPELVTVIGIQSGTTMAMQLQVIHSDIIRGSTLLLGQSYGVNTFMKKVSDKLGDNIKQRISNEDYQALKDKCFKEAYKNQ